MGLTTTTFEDKTKEERGGGSSSLEVHYVPFKLDYEGPANVKDLFGDKAKKNNKEEEEEEVLSNRFRGRPLLGKRWEVPRDYGAYVLKKPKLSDGGDEGPLPLKEQGSGPSKKVVEVVESFSSLTTWEWDKAPSSMDSLVKLQDWLQLANVLHQPVPVPVRSD